MAISRPVVVHPSHDHRVGPMALTYGFMYLMIIPFPQVYHLNTVSIRAPLG